jgi:isopenicillin N synthase-like dioxygenase
MQIPKVSILNLTDAPFPHPPVVNKYFSTLREFTQAIGLASNVIMSCLSKSLELPPGQGFEDYHRISMSTPDIVRLLKYQEQPIQERGAPQTPHTDLGSLTFLFTKQPGLQVLEHGSNEWAWVQPREGHAIVNLGDGMSLLTNKFFHTCLHRVGPLPGRAMETRYSFAYLQRAEARTLMTGLESKLIPAADHNAEVLSSEEWLLKKFGMLRLETRLESQAWILTNRKEAVPI